MSSMDEKFKQIITEISTEARSDYFENIIFRPSPKVAAMMEAYLRISKQSAASAFTDFISEQLANECSQSPELSDCILDSFKETLSRGFDMDSASALGILLEQGVATVNHESDMLKDLFVKNETS